MFERLNIEKMKNKEILLEWAATYGDDWQDVRACKYGQDAMLEFAEFYHQKKSEDVVLDSVSNRRELLIAFMDSLNMPDITQLELAKFEELADDYLSNL